jgi:hypothetical protein
MQRASTAKSQARVTDLANLSPTPSRRHGENRRLAPASRQCRLSPSRALAQTRPKRVQGSSATWSGLGKARVYCSSPQTPPPPHHHRAHRRLPSLVSHGALAPSPVWRIRLAKAKAVEGALDQDAHQRC